MAGLKDKKRVRRAENWGGAWAGSPPTADSEEVEELEAVEEVEETPVLREITTISTAIPEEIRKRSYIKALQSDRITVLVSSTEEAFQVPQDLLIQYSKSLGRMCRPGFIECTTTTIRLPEVQVPLFEELLVWLYAYEPRISQFKSLEPLIELGIFAEIYLINHLKNQISDAIRAGFGKDIWKLSPDLMLTLYTSVPSGAILRQLCAHGFAIRLPLTGSYDQAQSRVRRYSAFSNWQTVFTESADFGYDYFRMMQMASSPSVDINWGGACRFHDHSDIASWKQEMQVKCPFLRGPSPPGLEVLLLSGNATSEELLPNGEQAVLED